MRNKMLAGIWRTGNSYMLFGENTNWSRQVKYVSVGGWIAHIGVNTQWNTVQPFKK